MTIAKDIIQGKMPDFDHYLQKGETLDDIDEYGFTPLIESAIAKQPDITQALIARGVEVNKTDVTGRSALHWAVDNDDLVLTKHLLEAGALPNAFTRAGLSVLVYPLLRAHHNIKNLLCQYGAKLDFAQDFIIAKLIGHRFELRGDVDILSTDESFIEVNYEGFILEFTVQIIRDALMRFTSSYSTRHLRRHFHYVYEIVDAFGIADELLKIQRQAPMIVQNKDKIAQLIQSPLLILPAASRGHAFCFVRCGHWWAKIDRGENSLKEGTVNIYRMNKPNQFNLEFIHQFLYKRQPREFFHQMVNKILGLEMVFKMPLSPQIIGNCSWANVQGVVPVAYALLQLQDSGNFDEKEAMMIYEAWVGWDKDRAIDECIQRFYLASDERKASLAQMLGGILFQACDATITHHLERAEKILTVLSLPEYQYVLNSYLKVYCMQNLTVKGNNFLKILDDCGINPNIGVTPIATPLQSEESGNQKI